MLPEVARALQVSGPSLRKVFQTLARHGLVVSYRGIKGEYSLGVSAQEITLQDIVQAIEGGALVYQCMSMHQHCEPGLWCVVGSAFQEIEEQIRTALRNVSLAELVTRVQDGSKAV
jgi:Rrf2 family protein